MATRAAAATGNALSLHPVRDVQRVVNAPSSFDSAENYNGTLSGNFSPLNQEMGCTIISGQNAVRAHIPHLFCFGSPPTVVRRVWAIVVLPVECLPWRRLPHIGEKVLEITPAVADGDPSSSITPKGNVGRVLATLDQFPPSIVGGGMALSVNSRARRTLFGLETFAGTNDATVETIRAHHSGPAAGAVTGPVVVLPAPLKKPDYCQPSEYAPRKIRPLRSPHT